MPRLPGQAKGQIQLQKQAPELDSSTITLCLSLFPWAEHKRAKGGVKAHIMLDHDDSMPSFSCSPRPRWPMSP
ncbi:hypothetical protein DFAR_1540041 [Desulfarculales bacterium]